MIDYIIFQNSEHDDTINIIDYKVIAFMLYICCVLSTILAYCYVGECLIKEVKIKNEIFLSY